MPQKTKNKFANLRQDKAFSSTGRKQLEQYNFLLDFKRIDASKRQ
jgi:hypothetical protein